MRRRFGARSPLTALALAVALLAVGAGVAFALQMSNADGKWSNAVAQGGGGSSVGCLRWGNASQWSTNVNTYQDSSTTDENQVRFGGVDDANDCSPGTSQSGLGFDGSNGPLTFVPGDVFLLGKFVHYNNPVYYDSANNTLGSVDLGITLAFADPPGLNAALNYNVKFHETQNNLNPCPYGDSTGNGCDDRVTLPTSVPDQTFTIDGVPYTLQIIGFVPDADGVCPAAPAGAPSNIYTTGEQKNNYACMYGKIVLPVDSGDAPDLNAQTLGANRGRHNISSSGPFLGAQRGDGELDGQPTANANGDDQTDFDDEDGLLAVSPAWQSGTGQVTVSVNRGTASGTDRACVYAWIDWAGDGFGVGSDSTAQGERTAAGAGNVVLTFNSNLPAPGVFPTTALLRLRVKSSAGACPSLGSTGNLPTGLWTDGEIEDHQLQFSPTAVSLKDFAAARDVGEAGALAWAAALGVTAAALWLWRRKAAA